MNSGGCGHGRALHPPALRRYTERTDRHGTTRSDAGWSAFEDRFADFADRDHWDNRSDAGRFGAAEGSRGRRRNRKAVT